MSKCLQWPHAGAVRKKADAGLNDTRTSWAAKQRRLTFCASAACLPQTVCGWCLSLIHISGGDVFSFVMQLFELTFPQAVLRLAGDLGLSAVETAPGRAQAERMARERQERQTAHSALCRAVDAHFFRLHMYEQEADRLRPKPGDAAMHHDFLAALRGIEQEWAWLDANAWR